MTANELSVYPTLTSWCFSNRALRREQRGGVYVCGANTEWIRCRRPVTPSTLQHPNTTMRWSVSSGLTTAGGQRFRWKRGERYLCSHTRPCTRPVPTTDSSGAPHQKRCALEMDYDGNHLSSRATQTLLLLQRAWFSRHNQIPLSIAGPQKPTTQPRRSPVKKHCSPSASARAGHS